MTPETFEREMVAVGFPPHVPRVSADVHAVPYLLRTIARFDALNAAQREVVTFLAERPQFGLHRYPLPSANWALRQWAGLDAPGVLFRPRGDGRTPFEACRALKSEPELFAYVATFALHERAELLADLHRIPGDYSSFELANVLRDFAEEIDGSLGDWGLKVALQLLAPLEEQSPTAQAVKLGRGEPLRFRSPDSRGLDLPAYLALVRAGLSDDPMFDVLMPVSHWVSLDVRRECVKALPASRREAALLTAAEDEATGLLELLHDYPYASVASYVLERVHTLNNPKRALDALHAIGLANPAIAALVDAHLDAMGPIASLQFGARVKWPALDSLSDVQREQVLELARRWYRTNATAAEMLTPSEEKLLEHQYVDDAAGPVFEAWLNEGGEGLIFRVGTTEVVAHVGQYGVECEDPALLAALRTIW